MRKLLGQSSERFLARYHRAAWAPLFYPETVRAALRGEPTSLSEYPFWMPASGCVGDLVSRLREGLMSCPLATVSTHTLSNLSPAGTPAQAVGLPTERCLALLQQADTVPGYDAPPLMPPAAASVSVGFCRVRADAITQPVGCLMVVDEDFATYRLTDQDHQARRDEAWHRVTIEASPDGLAQRYPGSTPEAALSAELAALLGVANPDDIQMLKAITARNALAWPSVETIEAGQQAAQCLSEALPGVLLTGTLLGYGIASFNDQIVQGLKLAEELS